MADKKKGEWSEPKRDPKTGLQLHEDGLPLGKLARAKALAKAGRTEDPEGIASPENIAAFAPPPPPPKAAATQVQTGKE